MNTKYHSELISRTMSTR